MIFGIGTDIVDVLRVQQILTRQPRLPSRVLTTEEQKEFAARNHAPTYIAGRIAAKEALSKALRQGIRHPLTWQSVSVQNTEKGAPVFYFNEEMQNYLQTQKIKTCHLTIAHESKTAVAFVVAEVA